jgi:hypothetical protein
MNLATSKNLTVLGFLTIASALIAAGFALFDGDPSTNVDVGLLAVAIVNGIGQILAKGAKNTGGTVPS